MGKHVVLALLACSAILSVPGTGAGQDELARKLIPLASVIRSGDKKYRTIELRTHVRGFLGSSLPDAHYVVHVMYREPDQYSMCLYDGNSGAPILYSTRQGCIFYDAIANRILYCADACVRWSLEVRDDEVVLTYEFGKPNHGSSQIMIDFASFFRNRGGDVSAVATGKQKYQLCCDSPDGRSSLVTFIDLSKACPFTRIEGYAPESRIIPFISLDRINVNVEIDERNFTFPDKKTLTASFKMIESTFDEAWVKQTGLPTLIQVVLARMRAENPKLRFEQAFSENPDPRFEQAASKVNDVNAEAFKKTDTEMSNRLKTIFDWPLVGLERK